MKCPYCRKEMQKGVIRSGDIRGAVKFMPQGEKPGLFYSGQRLSNVQYKFNQFEIEADYCSGCGKMIFDTKLM